jgi:hypothetical protein
MFDYFFNQQAQEENKYDDLHTSLKLMMWKWQAYLMKYIQEGILKYTFHFFSNMSGHSPCPILFKAPMYSSVTYMQSFS